MAIRLDAVGVTARNLAASVAFYERLGFEFAPWSAEDRHVEAQTGAGRVRLMIDAAKLAEDLIGDVPRPANHAQFALLCDGAAEVDQIAGAMGGAIAIAPFDAPWGQRYATLRDPDGYLVDIFAPL
ncbi:Predicted lactoylglutathione lyase [Poseidonocella pacifica]|uniref:Predicted lactoylglutathione lyase n=1 Tax=Poseidonocella pacifica TaxID=871651 RepID=A0A1I0V8Y1_9RHOB|nr:VOC family protein [Poseidonocella pacifica]SFA72507.1 Predicted lactoylglutathione lyase [Poseidonocella pacifica]